MALLLNIDTATEIASVCISYNGESQALLRNDSQREHASFVHQAVNGVLEESGHDLKQIEGFAVTSGPGSYTGLRVGLATAKGFCYALSKPLITVNTLEVMTIAAIQSVKYLNVDALFCPMIDARRQEVFTALYDRHLVALLRPQPLILDASFLDEYLLNNRIYFFGSGSKKWQLAGEKNNATFLQIQHDASWLGVLAEVAFQREDFADVTYSEPKYFKDFHKI